MKRYVLTFVYAQAARTAAHEGNCPVPTSRMPCAACPPFSAVVEALDIICAADGAPSACAPARLVLHDARCINGRDCAQRDEHARRHTGAVTELRRFVNSHQPT